MTAPSRPSRSSFSDVPISRVREFWDARPCNVRHSRKPVGSREYFEEVEARKYFVEPHIPRFADFARWKNRRVLEVGCGIGTDTLGFARAGAEVTAVDLSRRSLELARTRAAVFGCKEIRFVEADAERLLECLPVEPFDLVYSFGVIHHTPDPVRALRVLRRYLAPDGTLKLMVYHRRSWKVFATLLREAASLDLDRAVARHSEAQADCPVTYTFSRRELRALLETNGFRVREMEVEHVFPWRIRDYVEHRYRKVWYFAWLPAPLFRALERRFGWHLCVTAEVA
jgi:SAM-dependent methyltransferase